MKCHRVTNQANQQKHVPKHAALIVNFLDRSPEDGYQLPINITIKNVVGVAVVQTLYVMVLMHILNVHLSHDHNSLLQ